VSERVSTGFNVPNISETSLSSQSLALVHYISGTDNLTQIDQETEYGSGPYSLLGRA